MYSASISISGAASGSGSFSLTLDGATRLLNANFDLSAGGETININGDTTFSLLSGRGIRSGSFVYDGTTIPAITITPSASDPLRYTGSVSMPNLGLLLLTIDFSPSLTDDADGDGTYDLFDSTPNGVIPSITVGTPPDGIVGRYYRLS